MLVRNRFHPIAVAGDIEKAFLQVRVREPDRDALRFHWIKDVHSTEVEILRFTRVVFGLTSSPFLFNGVIARHLELIEPRHPETVAEIRKSLYVDDLISGAPTTNEAAELKQDAIEIFDDAKFRLHKWHSNAPELESDMNDGALTFAKQQLRVSPKENGSKLLGLKWNKVEDSLQVDFPSTPAVLTKRGLLAYLAKVYDPLGLLSPMLLEGKILYWEVCETKVRWDGFIPDDLSKRWRKWESALPRYLSFPRSIPTYREPIQEVQLHSFGDASKKGLCAVVYAVLQQESGKVQRLVTAKSRLAKTNLTIPRLELVAGHMAVNLAVNVRNALEGFKMAENIHCWLDSSVALHWLNDDGQYRQFVANRVNKIRSHPNVFWRHVPTAENPADLGSRGGSVDGARLWCQGPDWLSDESRWPPKLVTKASDVSDAEKRVLREMSAVAVEASTSDNIIEKFELCKALRIVGWVTRFINNCRKVSTYAFGTITTDEIMKQEMVLVKQTQERAVSDVKFLEDKKQLGLALNEDGIWECHGRIQGEYPIYLPDTALFTTKIVQRAHLSTLHGGVAMVMAKVREKY